LPKAAIIFLKFGKVLPIPNALNFFCGFPSSKDRLYRLVQHTFETRKANYEL
jgi:hypothetical protein